MCIFRPLKMHLGLLIDYILPFFRLAEELTTIKKSVEIWCVRDASIFLHRTHYLPFDYHLLFLFFRKQIYTLNSDFFDCNFEYGHKMYILSNK